MMRRFPDAYVGLRFRDGGRERPAVDCWGLVRLVYMECCAIDLPRYGDVAAADLMAVALRMTRDAGAEPWRSVTEPRAFDVAVLAARAPRADGRSHPVAAHVGVMVSPTALLHVELASDAVVVGLDHPTIRHRLRGFYRHAILADAAAA